MCEKCLNSKFFCFAFSRIWTEYGDLRNNLQSTAVIEADAVLQERLKWNRQKPQKHRQKRWPEGTL